MEGYKLAVVASLLLVGWVEVHSQAFPYISFQGNILPNNSVVVLRDVGDAEDGSDSIQCHTNLSTCCSDNEGPDRGEWYFPSGSLVEVNGNSWSAYPTAQRVDLRRRDSSVTFPTNIYRCDIPVDNVDNAKNESVYVGIYVSSTHARIPQIDEILFSEGPETNRFNFQFILTCISSNGPPTNVTWYRDGQEISNTTGTPFGISSVLVNPRRTVYHNMLTVARKMEGNYMCTVENTHNSVSAEIDLAVASSPTCLSAVQDGPTSIRLQWRSPWPPGETTGFRIYYYRALTGHVDVSGVYNNTYVLTGLHSNASYGIRLAGLSDHLPSDINEGRDGVHLGPGTPVVTLTSVSPSSISFMWSVPEGSIVEEYQVSYKGDSYGSQISGSELITDGSTKYTIYGLGTYGPTEYHISVIANSTVGPASEATLNVYTAESYGDTGDIGSRECAEPFPFETAVGLFIGFTIGAFVVGLIIGTVLVIVVIVCIFTCRKLKALFAVRTIPADFQNHI